MKIIKWFAKLIAIELQVLFCKEKIRIILKNYFINKNGLIYNIQYSSYNSITITDTNRILIWQVFGSGINGELIPNDYEDLYLDLVKHYNSI